MPYRRPAETGRWAAEPPAPRDRGGADELLIGVDFGTTHSSIAACVDGKLRAVHDGGEARVPTVAYVPRAGALDIGRTALHRAVAEPQATALGIKRLLGRPLDGPGVAALRAGSIHRLVAGPDGSALVVLRGEPWSPVQLAAAVLRHLVERASAQLGDHVRGAVLTAPVTAPRSYHAALMRAAELAGLEVRRFVAEPVAAAIATSRGLRAGGLVMICDFGGGTFDAAVVEARDGIRASGCDGDDLLGGDDFDVALAEGVAGAVYRRHRVDLHRDVTAWGRLRLHCEQVKRQLSAAAEAHLLIRDAYAADGRHQDVDVWIDRPWAEGRWAALAARAAAVARRLLDRLGLEARDLDEVVLVGGTGRIPLVGRVLGEHLGRDVTVPADVDLGVVHGAAMVGTQLAARVAA
ncbi:MAG: Hsp70 family protein [Kofleriaceae bacterium]|nr:Hsp70 family protein [Kofleriaceae bacterium]MCB9574564.1 Hsp70 family protein [Kofleriaceae bacterium]